MAIAPPVETSAPDTTLPNAPPARLPWAVVGAVFIAFLTLFRTLVGGAASGGVASFGLPPLLVGAFGAVILLSYATPLRLGEGRLLRLLLRGAIIALVVGVINSDDRQTTEYVIGPVKWRNTLGLYWAGEIALQAWTERRTDNVQTHLRALLSSAFAFLAASNTFDDAYIWQSTPFYLLFVVLSLRGYRARRAAAAVVRTEGPGNRARKTTLLNVPFALRVLALVIALGGGAASVRTVHVYRGVINEWGNRAGGGRRGGFEGTGMAAQPQLGATFDLRGTPVRVLRITGLAGDNHLRGLSFDTYDRGTWGPSSLERAYERNLETRDISPLEASNEQRRGVRDQTTASFTRLVNDNPLVYAPLSSLAVDTGEATRVEWAQASGGPIRTNERAPYEYLTTLSESRPDFQGPLAVPITVPERKRCLAIPPTLAPAAAPGVARIAQRIFKGIPPGKTRARIDAVERYLITNHQYSLTFTPTTPDPVIGFLQERKNAHCEYFATAATLLLRMGGVPARYVTGYLAHENEGEGRTIVRQRDAHAWAEAWVGGAAGWVIVEATPGDGRPDQMTQAPVEPWRRALEWVQDELTALRDRVGDLSPVQASLAVGAVVGGALLIIAARALILRRRAQTIHAQSAFTYSATAPPDLPALAARFEAALARRNLAPPPSRPYAEHITRLAQAEAAPPALLDAARAFARAYDAARFGPSTPNAATHLSALATTVEQAWSVNGGFGVVDR